MDRTGEKEKSFGAVLAETREEVKEFFGTRIAILKAELSQKARTFKYAVPLLAGAMVLLLAGWIVLTFAFVGLLAGLFQPSPYAWVWAGFIIAGIYLLGGVAVGWFAYSELKSVGVAPNRTLEILKQDQVWIQNEARTA
ncbi:MAG TPA: phage holin family protein [Candidatus Limnocylindrales bacterium]|nr:phage holin family protein [Candidatus Limnocylindrales bacterium]